MNHQQVDPNVVPQFKTKVFRFKLGDTGEGDTFEPKRATEWLNDQILSGWGLFEFNKLFADGELVIIIVLARPHRRQVVPAASIPTTYEPRG